MSNITVIGSGYVGLTTAACFAYHGHVVIAVDIDEERVENLDKGIIPIFEEGLEDLVVSGLNSGKLSFTTDAKSAVSASEFIFFCLPTPQGANGQADLSFVENAAKDLATSIQPGSVVVNKSTVPIGSVRKVAGILKASGAQENISVVSNPEFLREGVAVRDALNPGRIVIGCDNKVDAQRVCELYTLFKAPTVITDPESAEMIKYSSNAFLACKISFINEMSRIADALGADIKEVAKGMGFDSRIGSQFLEPGPGYGGSCFPKDTSALLYSASQNNVEVPVINATIASNEQQFNHVMDIISKALSKAGVSFNEAKIAIWGLAFKAETDDVRDSPACEIVRRLVDKQVDVCAYDPEANENARKISNGMTILDSQYDVLIDADILVVLTEWSDFVEADYIKVKDLLKNPIIADMRNALNANEIATIGFNYFGLGRHQHLNNIIT